MKKQLLTLMALGIICLAGCNTKNRSDEIKNYTFQEKSTILNNKMKTKVGEWVEEGTVCYGLVVLVDTHGKILKGAPVKSKVVTFSADSIKMKALETVNMSEIPGCKKMGLSKGETWWETEGDLFKTKEEAETFLKGKGWLQH